MYRAFFGSNHAPQLTVITPKEDEKIPSIGRLIDNSKKDAHVANAQQMINAAKIAVTADKDLIPANGKAKTISLKYLEGNGYLETVKDPDGGTYIKDNNRGGI